MRASRSGRHPQPQRARLTHPRPRRRAILKVEDRRLEAIAARLDSLARHADPLGGPAGEDVEVLRDDGYGAQVCEALALAGLPTLGRIAGAALEGIPGIPAELVPACAGRSPGGSTLSRQRKTRTRPRCARARGAAVARDAADLRPRGPGIGRGIIHRLRQARLTDLAALAKADPGLARRTLPSSAAAW